MTADQTQPLGGPGAHTLGLGGILGMTVYLFVLAIVIVAGLAMVWPVPTPNTGRTLQSEPAQTNAVGGNITSTATRSETIYQDPAPIAFFHWHGTMYNETRLLLIVLLAGALGGLVHGLRSLGWYVGNRGLVASWTIYYVLLPIVGPAIALIFYFVVRGGFFSPSAGFQNTSPFGFAALSSLVGLFSQQAVLKLQQVAETLLTKPSQGSDSKPQPTGG